MSLRFPGVRFLETVGSMDNCYFSGVSTFPFHGQPIVHFFLAKD